MIDDFTEGFIDRAELKCSFEKNLRIPKSSRVGTGVAITIMHRILKECVWKETELVNITKREEINIGKCDQKIKRGSI